jgi:hypothetical protein
MKRTVIDDLISNLKRIKPETILQRSVPSSSLEIAADINRAQLQDGQLSNGQELGNYTKATESYNNVRQTKVSSSERVKFYDSGKFHKSIKGKITKEGLLNLTSGSNKVEKIREYLAERGYSGDVLGLTDENLENWIETFVQPYFVKGIQDRLLTQ